MSWTKRRNDFHNLVHVFLPDVKDMNERKLGGVDTTEVAMLYCVEEQLISKSMIQVILLSVDR